MTTERDATRIVRSWLHMDEHESADRILGVVLDRLDATPQRRHFWRAWRTFLMNSTLKFAAVAATAVVVAGIGLAIYFSQPAFSPAASPSPTASAPVSTATPSAVPSPTPSASPQPTDSPAAQARVAYTALPAGCAGVSCIPRIWTVNLDGTDPREYAPDLAGAQAILGWVPNGSSLFFTVTLPDANSPAVYQALVDGSERDQICGTTGPCPFPLGWFSPSETHLAYARTLDNGATTVIAVMNPGTGQSVDLDSTRAPTDVQKCETADTAGSNGLPGWAPDGDRFAFARTFAGHPSAESNICRQGVIFTVNANGTELTQLTPADMAAFAEEWSPDGSTILFAGDERKPSSLLWATDLYTITPDGTAMHALTTDGGAAMGHWTKDGRIVYRHFLEGGTFDAVRLVNQDGSNETAIDASDLPGLTELGCTICPYTPAIAGSGSADLPEDAFWQPIP
jgi:Tol biopolymer transport system component